MLRLPAGPTRDDRGKNHDPAVMASEPAAAWHRARLRQDRSAPLRGGLRPVLTQSPLGAWITLGPGRKATLQAEQRTFFTCKNGRPSTEPRNTVTMGVTATQDSTFEWREIGAQVTGQHGAEDSSRTTNGITPLWLVCTSSRSYASCSSRLLYLPQVHNTL